LGAVDPEQPQSHGQQLLAPSFAHSRNLQASTKPVLLGARASTTRFTAASQAFLQDTNLTPLPSQFATDASAPAWTAAASAKERRPPGAPVTEGVSEVVIPTFSLLPSQTIQRIAEACRTSHAYSRCMPTMKRSPSRDAAIHRH
jgi:hypothetical protein